MEKESAIVFVPFLRLTWGDGTGTAHWVRYDEDVDLLGTTYASAPELAVEPYTRHGGTEDKPLTFILRRAREPFDKLCRPYPHSTVTVDLYESDPRNVAVYRHVFSGKVAHTVKNQAGFAKLVRVTAAGRWADLNYSLGIVADTTCSWTFADNPGPKNCGKSLAAVTHAATLTSVSGVDVTTSPVSGAYWVQGTIRRGGCSVTILEGNGTQFKLQRAPPPEWLGEPVEVIEGCDGKLETCRIHQNERRFGGFGIGIPAYHPMVHDPGSTT